MKTAAVVAEYNPFHLGHAWQIAAIRHSLGDACAVIAVMSGCFTQRGEPALIDKWNRARSALACGADLVIELPFAYAASSAERFAAGGVGCVQATGLDCHLVFGSECGDLASLEQLADLLCDEPEDYRRLLRQQLDAGMSFPAARQSAVAAWTGQPGLAALLAQSNNILAVEYLKAIRKLPQSRLTPLTLQRQGQSYRAGLDDEPDAGFASATAIRQAVGRRLAARSPLPGRGRLDAAGLFQDLLGKMPAESLAILLATCQTGPGPLTWEDLGPAAIGTLLSQPADAIENLPGMGEGLARRLVSCAGRLHSSDFSQLLSGAATRRFPQTRIQRALLGMLAGLRHEDLRLFDEAGGPQYLRVLGFNRKGRYLLKIMRRLADVPIIMKGSDFLEYKQPALRRMAELDILATDLWMLAAGCGSGRDFDTLVVMG
jgi:predicted nucleotidyltransferase